MVLSLEPVRTGTTSSRKPPRKVSAVARGDNGSRIESERREELDAVGVAAMRCRERDLAINEVADIPV